MKAYAMTVRCCMMVLTIWGTWNMTLSYAQSTSDSVGFTAVPPTKTEPKTPLSLITSTLDDPLFRELAYQEENRFKLLNQNTSSNNWLDQYRQKELMDEYSLRVSKLFMNSVKDNFKDTLSEALEDSAFAQIIDLAKSAKNITDQFKNSGARRIAMSFSPNPQEPSLGISNLGLDQIHLTYNVLYQSPAFSVEQKIKKTLTSQLYYNMFYQTLDSALKKNITDTVHLHVINRNQFTQHGEKSLILGVSFDIK